MPTKTESEMKFQTLCLFCGSATGNHPAYAQAAKDLARFLLVHNMDLVYGGANVGLMKIVADAMLEGNGHVVGIMPRSLVDREVAHDNLSELIVVDGMQARKALMADRSDGFVALPGGFGTFDELFEILTWNQLNLIRKPIGLLNIMDYFTPLLQQLDHAVDEGFLRKEHRQLLISDSEVGSLIEKMDAFEPIEAHKWIDRLKKGKI
jgi:uncharacterized protein (TIGR00730 family)